MRRQHIFVNFKRFDVPHSLGGVNRGQVRDWASSIVAQCLPTLSGYDSQAVRFAMYFPESQLFGALDAVASSPALEVGCQGVHRADVSVGGNFGAFTTLRPAAAMAAMGVKSTIIGHCEERNGKRYLVELAGGEAFPLVDRILNEEVLCAQERGLSVLFCVGERAEEVERWDEVIRTQLQEGLKGADLDRVTIAYEPVWSIGPGRTPAGKDYITKVARLVKRTLGDVPVVYGGGLKEENAEMLASIDEIDGGLVALTRFSGEIGFYSDEFLNIVRLYLGRKAKED